MANFHGKELVRKLKQNLPKMFSGLKREHTDLNFFFFFSFAKPFSFYPVCNWKYNMRQESKRIWILFCLFVFVF